MVVDWCSADLRARAAFRQIRRKGAAPGRAKIRDRRYRIDYNRAAARSAATIDNPGSAKIRDCRYRIDYNRAAARSAATIDNPGSAKIRDRRYRIDYNRADATVARKRPGRGRVIPDQVERVGGVSIRYDQSTDVCRQIIAEGLQKVGGRGIDVG